MDQLCPARHFRLKPREESLDWNRLQVGGPGCAYSDTFVLLETFERSHPDAQRFVLFLCRVSQLYIFIHQQLLLLRTQYQGRQEGSFIEVACAVIADIRKLFSDKLLRTKLFRG